MKKRIGYLLCIALILVSATAVLAAAPKSASLNFAITPTASWTVGGNSVHVLPDSGCCSIPATLSIGGFKGNITPPLTVNLTTGHAPPSGPAATLSSSSCYFPTAASTCAITISFTSQASTYNITVSSDGGTDSVGNKFAVSGQTETIHHEFTAPECTPDATALTVSNTCVLFHQPTATLTFSLTDTTNPGPVAGATISYTVAGGPSGTATTGLGGSASVSIDTSLMLVGDHAVTASFAGSCDYLASNGNGNLGIYYNISPFLQPIPNPINRFKGKVCPAKIRVSDYYGNSVPDASIYFSYQATAACGDSTTEDVVDGDPLANTNNDSGNLFRYDPVGQIYIFNWNLSNVAAGWYYVYANAGDGSCAPTHSACVQIVK